MQAINYHTIKPLSIFFIILGCLTISKIHAQVGVGTTSPNATLDIEASNTSNPANSDGILIPRVDNFPSTNPTADQDGMMIFATGNGTPSKGFYFWDNSAANWINVKGVEKINDLTDAKSDDDGTFDGASIFFGIGAGVADDGSNNFNNALGYQALNAVTTGNLNTAIGGQSLFLNETGGSNIAMGYHALYNNISGNDNIALGTNTLRANQTGFQNTAIGVRSLSVNTSFSNTALGANSFQNNTSGNLNLGLGANTGRLNVSGSQNTFIGTNAGNNNLGSGNVMLGFQAGLNETGSNRLYIENSSADPNNALIYGEFGSDILRTNGEFQIGNPSGTGFRFPTVDGTNGQVLTTDGLGNVSFQDIVGDGTGTDNQILTLNTNILSIQNGNSIDLSTINPNTDDQEISNFNFNTITNVLSIELEDDGQPPQTVNLSSLQDGTGTDNQILGLASNILSISGGNSVNLSGINPNTDDQQIDTFNFNASTNILSLELEDDGQAIQTVDLSSLQNSGTDNQQVDTFSFNASTNQLTLELESDFQAPHTVNLSGLEDSDWYQLSTTNTPNSISMSIYTENDVTINDGTLFVNSNKSQGVDIFIDESSLTRVGLNIDLDGTTPTTGISSFISNRDEMFSQSNLTGIYQIFAGGNTSTNSLIGTRNWFTGSSTYTSFITGTQNDIDNDGDGNHYGTSNLLSGSGTGEKYGTRNIILSTAGGTHYGVYSNVVKSGSYAGYFLGNVSIGTNTINNYILPASRGTINQILQTDGSGNVSWVDPSSVFTDTDTDDQQISDFSFDTTTNVLSLEIEDDGQVPQTVDLSSLNPVKSIARIIMSASQTEVGPGTTKVNFDTVDFDINSNYNTTSNAFIVPSDGLYRVTAQITMASNTGTGNFGVRVRVNGSQQRRSEYNHSGVGTMVRQVTSILNLTAGQSLDVSFIRPAVGATIESNSRATFFEIEQL